MDLLEGSVLKGLAVAGGVTVAGAALGAYDDRKNRDNFIPSSVVFPVIALMGLGVAGLGLYLVGNDRMKPMATGMMLPLCGMVGMGIGDRIVQTGSKLIGTGA